MRIAKKNTSKKRKERVWNINLGLEVDKGESRSDFQKIRFFRPFIQVINLIQFLKDDGGVGEERCCVKDFFWGWF